MISPEEIYILQNDNIYNIIKFNLKGFSKSLILKIILLQIWKQIISRYYRIENNSYINLNDKLLQIKLTLDVIVSLSNYEKFLWNDVMLLNFLRK